MRRTVGKPRKNLDSELRRRVGRDWVRTPVGAAAVDLTASVIPRRVLQRLLRSSIWILRQDSQEGKYGLDDFVRTRSIFFHIPKTAGIAVSEALFQGRRGASHLTPEHAKLVLGAKRFRAFFKFTVVRNPFDRVVSAWSFLRGGGLYRTHSRWTQEHVLRYDSFAEFAVAELESGRILSDVHFQPQVRFITDRHDTLLVDFLGRFESLQQDFQALAGQLGIDAELTVKNRSERQGAALSDDYDRRTVEVVRRVYRKDFELLGYSMDLPF